MLWTGQGKGCPPGIAVVATWKNSTTIHAEWMKMDSGYPNIVERMVSRWILPRHMPQAMKRCQGLHRIHEYLKNRPQHTVIWCRCRTARHWGVRDFSPVAQQLFEQRCPMHYLSRGAAAEHPPAKEPGKVFGTVPMVFPCWSVARYIEYVAAGSNNPAHVCECGQRDR